MLYDWCVDSGILQRIAKPCTPGMVAAEQANRTTVYTNKQCTAKEDDSLSAWWAPAFVFNATFTQLQLVVVCMQQSSARYIQLLFRVSKRVTRDASASYTASLLAKNGIFGTDVCIIRADRRRNRACST